MQQRGALAGWAAGAVGAVRGRVSGERAQVALVLLEGDVSRMRVGNQGPLLPRHRAVAGLTLGRLAGATLPICERAGIARVVQGAQHARVRQRRPDKFSLALPEPDTGWEQQPVAVERLHDRAGRAGPGEAVKQMADRSLNPGVGVQHDLAGRVLDQSDWQRHR